jgi:hypothetical protein
MAEDEGLPIPPPPVRRTPTAKPGENDLDVKMVRDDYNQISADSNQATQAWADKVSNAAARGAPLKAPEFKGEGPGLLTPIESELDKTMGVDINHTEVLDILKSVGAGMGYMFSHPYTSIKDASMIERIKAAQAKFLADYPGPLTRMSEYLADVRQNFGAISDLLKGTNFSRGRLDQIMKEKADCGNSAYADLMNALDDTTDPEQRAALEKQRGRLDEFKKQRDGRIAREKPTVDGLASRVEAMENEVLNEREVIEEARRSRGPVNTESGGRIIDSTHIRPEALDFARGLRDVLSGSRARFDKAMSKGTGV